MSLLSTINKFMHDEQVRKLTEQGYPDPEAELIKRETAISKKNELIEAAKVTVISRWSSLRNKQHFLALKRNARIDIVNSLLSNGVATEVIKPTKTNLNKLIIWSSSRINEYRKPDVISSIMNKIQHASSELDGASEYSCGCYSEGAHGYGSNRAAFKNCKWTGGDYRFLLINGMPYLILGESKNSPVIMFKGFDYVNPIQKNIGAEKIEASFNEEIDTAVRNIENQHGSF